MFSYGDKVKVKFCGWQKGVVSRCFPDGLYEVTIDSMMVIVTLKEESIFRRIRA
jgi:hypothetical protein